MYIYEYAINVYTIIHIYLYAYNTWIPFWIAWGNELCKVCLKQGLLRHCCIKTVFLLHRLFKIIRQSHLSFRMIGTYTLHSKVGLMHLNYPSVISIVPCSKLTFTSLLPVRLQHLGSRISLQLTLRISLGLKHLIRTLWRSFINLMRRFLRFCNFNVDYNIMLMHYEREVKDFWCPFSRMLKHAY